MTTQAEPMKDITEFARRAKCSPDTIRRLVKAGKLPAPVRVGRLLRWPTEVIDSVCGRTVVADRGPAVMTASLR